MPKADDKDDKKSKDEKNRGTQDELEILALVIQQNLAVRMAVMDKLRAAKARVAAKPGGGLAAGSESKGAKKGA